MASRTLPREFPSSARHMSNGRLEVLYVDQRRASEVVGVGAGADDRRSGGAPERRDASGMIKATARRAGKAGKADVGVTGLGDPSCSLFLDLEFGWEVDQAGEIDVDIEGGSLADVQLDACVLADPQSDTPAVDLDRDRPVARQEEGRLLATEKALAVGDGHACRADVQQTDVSPGSQAVDRRSHKRDALRFLTGPDDD